MLKQIGIVPEVLPAAINETPRRREAPANYVRRLARAKAAAVARDAPGAVVVGADTAVVIDGEILEKPADAASARAMLARLAARDHDVLTGVAVATDGQTETVLSRSRVTFRAIAPEEIAAYVASGEGADKAGGYAIQGLGAIFVAHLAGSYSGVMGLPLCETAALLGKSGFMC